MAAEALPEVCLKRAAPSPLKYEALKERFVRKMEEGELSPGEPLPTEQSLAESLGVARSTVRRAMASLEQDGLITRTQGKGTFVHESVKQRLQKKRGSGLFALLVPQTQAGFYPSLLHGFETASGDKHHQTIFCSTEDSLDKQGNAILQLLDKEVAGVAMVPIGGAVSTPAYQVRQLQNRGIPVVFCHRGVEGVVAPLITFDAEGVGRIAGQTLLGQGHKRVAYFGRNPGGMVRAYRDGFCQSLEASGIDLPESRVFIAGAEGSDRSHVNPESDSSDHEEGVARALQEMLDRPDRPTAIFTSFDAEAELLYLLLTQLGLRVPEDISLVGFGGAQRDGALANRLTSVTVDEATLGRRAAELLEEIASGRRSMEDSETITMPLGLSAGQTVGPAK